MSDSSSSTSSSTSVSSASSSPPSGKFRAFLNAGHWPTLFSAFLYFDVCFAIWVLNGAMAPFISESFSLTAAQKGLMISLPIFSGALLRFPLGVLSEYIGRKPAAIVEMSLICVALLYGCLFVHSYHAVLFMGLLLGIAGASFGVALTLGSGSYPAEYKGLAMGIAGAGNSGTVIATLFGPPLAQRYGWNAVYGIALVPMLIAMAVLILCAKEPEKQPPKKLSDYLKVITEKDAWTLNLVYVVTFGGFIGLANFLPTFFHDQYGITKIKAGQFATMVVLMGSVARVLGGYLSDLWGGVKTLKIVLALVLVGVSMAGFLPAIVPMTLVLLLVFAGLGAGNGAVFQLVPLRFPFATAVASSLIGEIGALGGTIIPNAMGISRQVSGSFAAGFAVFGFLTVASVSILILREKKWVNLWMAEGGKAMVPVAPLQEGRVVMVPAMEIW